MKRRKPKDRTESTIVRANDPTVKMMRAPCFKKLALPLTPASVASALACEVGVHGCRPAPCCRAVRKDLLDESFPIAFFDREGEPRWRCEAGCELDGKPLEGGALSFAVAYLHGETFPESDPRVAYARTFLRGLE